VARTLIPTWRRQSSANSPQAAVRPEEERPSTRSAWRSRAPRPVWPQGSSMSNSGAPASVRKRGTFLQGISAPAVQSGCPESAKLWPGSPAPKGAAPKMWPSRAAAAARHHGARPRTSTAGAWPRDRSTPRSMFTVKAVAGPPSRCRPLQERVQDGNLAQRVDDSQHGGGEHAQPELLKREGSRHHCHDDGIEELYEYAARRAPRNL
jgi:hypothetical protein